MPASCITRATTRPTRVWMRPAWSGPSLSEAAPSSATAPSSVIAGSGNSSAGLPRKRTTPPAEPKGSLRRDEARSGVGGGVGATDCCAELGLLCHRVHADITDIRSNCDRDSDENIVDLDV